MNGMTIKQVAELCQVDERTIQRWAAIAGDKMSSSTSTYPAAFTLPETIAIIKAGGRSTLADLLQEGMTVYLLHKFMRQPPPSILSYLCRLHTYPLACGCGE